MRNEGILRKIERGGGVGRPPAGGGYVVFANLLKGNVFFIPPPGVVGDPAAGLA